MQGPSDNKYRLAKSVTRFLANVFYRFNVTGIEHLKNLKPPYIFAANHHSTIERVHR